jgi:hypothetical protein
MGGGDSCRARMASIWDLISWPAHARTGPVVVAANARVQEAHFFGFVVKDNVVGSFGGDYGC